MNTDVNLLSFNSTLVQLKDFINSKHIVLKIGFNSTLVQLKEWQMVVNG